MKLSELEIGQKAKVLKLDIELRDYQLCIRKADLAQIEVEVIK